MIGRSGKVIHFPHKSAVCVLLPLKLSTTDIVGLLSAPCTVSLLANSQVRSVLRIVKFSDDRFNYAISEIP